MFWNSKNSLLKVTVSPASARRIISRDWLVRAPRSLKGHTETFELFPFEADTDAELKTTAGDDINCRDVLGKAYRIVKRHHYLDRFESSGRSLRDQTCLC